MMNLPVLVLACFVAAFGCVEGQKKFTFQNCQQEASIAKIVRFSLSPDPISFSRDVSATVDLVLDEEIPEGTLVVQNIWKVTSLFGLPIKYHVGCYGGKGSCTTEICEYMGSFKKQACPFFPPGSECSCPLKAGNYRGEKVTIPMPPMHPLLKWIASGEFLTEIRLVKKEGSFEKQIACFQFNGYAEA